MIFNLFKSKPTLKDLIPKGFIDIHSHILPGIDDGAENIEESLRLITEMKKLGFSKIIGTPHTYPGLYDNTNNSIKKSYEKVSKKLNSEIKLNYASEYMIDGSLINKANERSLLCVKKNLVLIELSYLSESNKFSEIIFHLFLNNYIPILAHPERYNYWNKKKLLNVKKKGVKFQLNLLSITGYYGKEALHKANFLLENNMIDFVGSDIHNQKHINEFYSKIKINKTKKLEEVLQKMCKL